MYLTVQALRSKTTPTAPVVNVVNNCDGTSTQHRNIQVLFIMEYW
jgi:hypothetical protein